MAPFPPDRVASSFPMIPHRPPSEETAPVYRCDHPGCDKGFTRKVSVRYGRVGLPLGRVDQVGVVGSQAAKKDY